jgi:hypothetical protein
MTEIIGLFSGSETFPGFSFIDDQFVGDGFHPGWEFYDLGAGFYDTELLAYSGPSLIGSTLTILAESTKVLRLHIPLYGTVSFTDGVATTGAITSDVTGVLIQFYGESALDYCSLVVSSISANESSNLRWTNYINSIEETAP